MKRYILQIIGLVADIVMQQWNYFNYYFLNFPNGGPAVTPYVKLHKDVFIAHLAFIVFFLILNYLSYEAINMWI